MRLTQLLLGFLLVALSAQTCDAKYFWFFDDPKGHQDITLVIQPQDVAAGLDRFVGKTIKLTPKDKNTEPIEVMVQPQNKFKDMQIRILMPDTVVGDYEIEVPGMNKDENLLPKELKVKPKVYDAIFLVQKPKKVGEAKSE